MIASSDTDIANLAISNLGTSKEIGNLVSEQSREAAACRRFYEMALKGTLRAYDWGFARQTVTLSLVSDFTGSANNVSGYGLSAFYPFDDAVPNYPNAWSYAYRYPAAVVAIRKIFSGARLDDSFTAVPWEINSDAAGQLIMTDMPAAAIVATTYVQTVEFMPADFVLAFSQLLASMIAPRITGGDPQGLGTKALQKWQMMISQAQAADAQESQMDMQRESELIESRDF